MYKKEYLKSHKSNEKQGVIIGKFKDWFMFFKIGCFGFGGPMAVFTLLQDELVREKKILTNKDFEKMLETSDEWIRTRTGVEERRIAAEDEFASDMGASAAKEALKDANLNGSDIDFILVATSTPDYIFPSTACLIQEKIGANNSAALDVQAACSGFIYALTL